MKKLLIAALTLALTPVALAQGPAKSPTGKRIAKRPVSLAAKCVVGKPGIKIVNPGKSAWLPTMGIEWKTDDGQTGRRVLKRPVKVGGAIKIKLKHRAKTCKARVVLRTRRPGTQRPPAVRPGQPQRPTALQASCRTGRPGIKIVNSGKRAWPARATVQWKTGNGQAGKRLLKGAIKPGGAIKIRVKKSGKACKARIVVRPSRPGATRPPVAGPAQPQRPTRLKADCRVGRKEIKIVNSGKGVWPVKSVITFKTNNGQRGRRPVVRPIKPGGGIKLPLKRPAKLCKAFVTVR